MLCVHSVGGALGEYKEGFLCSSKVVVIDIVDDCVHVNVYIMDVHTNVWMVSPHTYHLRYIM